MSEHTRNQKRMYRIHKQEEKILEQELMIASLQQKVEQLENIIKEAIEYIQNNKNNTSQTLNFDKNESYNSALIDLLNILNKGSDK